MKEVLFWRETINSGIDRLIFRKDYIQGNQDRKNLFFKKNMQGFKEKNPNLTANKSFENLVSHFTYLCFSF